MLELEIWREQGRMWLVPTPGWSTWEGRTQACVESGVIRHVFRGVILPAAHHSEEVTRSWQQAFLSRVDIPTVR